jgi:hypothetical protein
MNCTEIVNPFSGMCIWLFAGDDDREGLNPNLAPLNDYAEQRARELIRPAVQHFETDLETLRRARKGEIGARGCLPP